MDGNRTEKCLELVIMVCDDKLLKRMSSIHRLLGGRTEILHPGIDIWEVMANDM